MSNMRIAMDARELSRQQSGGFRSYVRGLLSGLAQVDSENDYVLYTDRPLDRSQLSLPARCRVVEVSGGRIQADHIGLPRAIRRDRPDLVHFPCNYGISGLTAPMVITLHDCIGLRGSCGYYSLRSGMLSRYTAWMTCRSVESAAAILTISEYARDRILDRFDVADRTLVGYIGINPGLAAARRCEERPLVDGPYILCLASSDLRKNVCTIIRAYLGSTLPAAGCRLAVVASHKSARDAVQRASGGASDVLILERVDDAELACLYRNGVAFVFASLEEGFGLPPVEAMTFGSPVISSHCSAMPEVLGDAALYFNPSNILELVEKLESVWSDEDLREDLRVRGEERAKLYSWRRCAEQVLTAYQMVASRRDLCVCRH